MQEFLNTRDYLSSGRSLRLTHQLARAANFEACVELVRKAAPEWKLLAVGSGQSLGDSGLNGDNALIVTRDMDRIASLSRQERVVECEPGVTIGQLAAAAIDTSPGQRLFPHVIPGTDVVTVAGAIANDVHGKNHISHGSFCHHVEGLTLLRSTGEVASCSEASNPDLFRATLGGLGLTGIIVSARLRLRSVPGALLLSEESRFENLDEAFALLAESREPEYRFFWFDPFSARGRGLFVRSGHVDGNAADVEPPGAVMKALASLPFPAMAGGPAVWRAWYGFMLSRSRDGRSRLMSHADVLAPLGQFRYWNRLFGAHGLLHFQSVAPAAAAEEVIAAMLADCRGAGEPPCIASVKEFGPRTPAGMLSFPREGITLALDFANRGDTTRALLARLEARVVEAGGAVYPGKDSTMSASAFRRMFPEWETFAAHVDPRFSSNFWRRVVGPS